MALSETLRAAICPANKTSLLESSNRLLQDTTIALIAGGRSSRFGSNKLIHPFRGKPVIQWVVEAAQEISNAIFLVSRREQKEIRALFPSLTIVPDLEGYEGPLAGVAAALAHATRPRVLVLAADLPLIRGHMLSRLVEAAGQELAAAPVIDGILQPLCAVYSSGLAGLAAELLAQGKGAVHTFFEAAHGKRLDAEILGTPAEVLVALQGVNTRQELKDRE
jgi:molybdopterin-guanine dinucleotide biosynthesis protein A